VLSTEQVIAEIRARRAARARELADVPITHRDLARGSAHGRRGQRALGSTSMAF
jgi:hypothetical protein